MFKSDKRRLALKLLALIVIVSPLALLSSGAPSIPLVFSTSAFSQGQVQQPHGKTIIRVDTKQLDLVGPAPILTCEDAELSKPNAIEKLSCVIKNNTQNYITAGTLRITVELEKEGRVLALSSYDTFDTFLHPDFREDHKGGSIPPEGEYRLSQLPSTYDNAVVKRILVETDYIEFADKTGVGPSRRGFYILASIREGAAKYKNWLAEKYTRSGKSIDSILRSLEETQVPVEELRFQNSDEEHGANMYRKYAQRLYKAKGADGLTKHLNVSNSFK